MHEVTIFPLEYRWPKIHFYVMKKFCDFFYLRSSDLNTTLTYVHYGQLQSLFKYVFYGIWYFEYIMPYRLNCVVKLPLITWSQKAKIKKLNFIFRLLCFSFVEILLYETTWLIIWYNFRVNIDIILSFCKKYLNIFIDRIQKTKRFFYFFII